ncbi:MAG: DNA cytosine methyltransferase, partial [Crocinitomicaceae bacterium]
QIFLRIVAVKKWKKNSILKAWFMENVPSSIKHLAAEYTFEELGLSEWAQINKIGKSKIAIKLEGNQKIINSANYGCAQNRERVIAGEIISKNKLITPAPTHSQKLEDNLIPWVPLEKIINTLPKPTSSKSNREITDPNYPNLLIPLIKLKDHFYDSGLYACEWKQSAFLKINHPYMGKMSFPENTEKPSRTVTATKIGTSREALIYRSEFNRFGDGEFRTPTVREASCIMGFPVTFQFLGSEGTKWRLIGNAVCPSVSRSIATEVLKQLNLSVSEIILQTEELIEKDNLNTFTEKNFHSRPTRNKGSRFRRHPFKDGNITVTLSNYDIDKNEKNVSKWRTSVQYGNGDGFPTYNYPNGFYKKIESLIAKIEKGQKFLEIINNGFSEKIGNKITLQEMYELQASNDNFLEPTELIEEVKNVVEKLGIEKEKYEQKNKVIFKNKEVVPVKQLFALYAINKISSTANRLPI